MEDGERQQYEFIEEARLPAGVHCLRNPRDWSLKERSAWSKHLRDGDNRLLEPERVFQFRQPRPGVKVESSSAKRPDGITMSYPPESLAYAMARQRSTQPTPRPHRPDGLPYLRDGQVYRPFTESTMEELSTHLRNSGTWTALHYAIEYEGYSPHHVSRLKHTMTGADSEPGGLEVLE